MKKSKKTRKTTQSARPKTAKTDAKGRLLTAAIKHANSHGWGDKTLELAAKDIGVESGLALLHFPNLPRDLLAAYLDWGNDALESKLKKMPGTITKIREKIAYGVRQKIETMAPYKNAEKKAVAILARPAYADISLPALYRTCDIIWRAAGDKSADWNFYSKRILLAGVYTSTLLFWLKDSSKNSAETWKFLDRRIENVMAINDIKRNIKQWASVMPDALNIARKMRKAS